MKYLLTILVYLIINYSSLATAVICPIQGDEDCMEVDAVFMFGDWIDACCDIMEVPDGWECVQDDCYLAKKSKDKNVNYPTLTKKNAFVYFNSGYRTWALVNNEPRNLIKSYDFNMETMRSFLPKARKIFLEDDNIERIAFLHDSNFKVVVERPSKKEELKEEIEFPDINNIKNDFLESNRVIAQDNLVIAPNPADGQYLNLRFKHELKIIYAEIITLDGKVVIENTIQKPVNRAYIELNNLPNGVYLIKVKDESGRLFSRKLYKE